MALETGCLDEPPGAVVRRILEDAAEAANPIRLRRLALRLDRVGTLPNPIRIIGMDAEAHTHDHVAAELVLETRVAVAEVAGGGGEGERLPPPGPRRAGGHPRPPPPPHIAA